MGTHCAGRATFNFHGLVSAETKRVFRDDFCVAVGEVRDWTGENLGARYEGNFLVDVFPSDGPAASLALVPAWRGDRGRMRFPSWRVENGTAAITHELVHVFAPNQNRFLAEGIAVYVQWTLHPDRAVFPNDGVPLDEAVRHYAETADLAALDAVETPARLRHRTVPAAKHGAAAAWNDAGSNARIGDAALRAAGYLVAGSFVKFLIDSYGVERFRTLYGLTPLRPHAEGHVGTPDRWIPVYGKPLASLEAEWKSRIRDAGDYYFGERAF